MRLSLAHKINLITVTIALLASSLVAIVIYHKNYDIIVKYQLSNHAQVVKDELHLLKKELDIIKEDVLFLAHLPSIQGIVRTTHNNGIDPLENSTTEQWKSRLETTFKSILKERKNYLQARFIRSDGNELVRVEKKGDIISSFPLQNKINETYFQGSVKTPLNTVHLSDITPNSEYGEVVEPITYVLRFSTPIYDTDNNIFGVIIININFNSILESLVSDVINGSIFITDYTGQILADHGLDHKHNKSVQKEYSKSSYLPDIFPFLEHEYNKETAFDIYKEYWKEDTIIQLFKIMFDEIDNNFLSIVLINDKESILTPTNNIRNQTILLLVITTIISGILAWLLSLGVSSPLSMITTFIHKVGDPLKKHAFADIENLPALPLNRKDEVGELANILYKTMLDLHTEHGKATSIIEESFDGIILINEKGIITAFNRTAETIFGYSRTEAVGQNVNILMPEPYHSKHDSYIHNYLTSGKAKIIGYGRQVEGKRKDGTVFPLDLAVSKLVLDKETTFLGTVRDITERVEAEEKNAQLSNILKTLLNEIYIFDAESLKFLFVNNGALANIGYSEKEIKQLTPLDLKPDYVLDEFKSLIDPIKENRAQNTSINTIHQRKNGTTYPVHIFLQPCVYESKNAFVAMVIDTTQQEETMERLQASEERFRSMFEQAPIGMALCKMDGTLLAVNKSYAKIIGYTQEQCLRLSYWDITPKRYEHQEAEQLESLSARGTYGPYEKHYTHKDGHEVPVILRGNKIQGFDGNEYIWSFIEDITEKTASKKKLLEYQRNLEKMVDEKTADLVIALQQAEAAQAEAEEANNAKTEFLANISHELRTPMHAILGFSRQALKKMDDEASPQTLTLIENIQTSGNRLMELINDLLDLSKLESHSIETTFIPADIAGTIALTINEISPLAEEKDITIITDSAIDDNQLTYDNKLITQVFVNLLSNAIKFSPENTTITITLSNSMIDQQKALLCTIKDQGIGIPDDELEHIFDKFIQSKKTRSGAGGTGLGLAITKEIIDLHHGKIWAENNPDKGSCFYILLPYTLSKSNNEDNNT